MIPHEISQASAHRPTVGAEVAQQVTNLSTTVRHLAFAGIAAIWVFRLEGVSGIGLSFQLAVAGFFLICSLATDLLESVLRVVVAARGGTLSMEDPGSHRGWKYAIKGSPERVLLLLKLGFLVVAYAWLFAHLYNVIVML